MAGKNIKSLAFKSNFFLIKLFVNLLLIFLFLSCQTTPPSPEAYLEQGILPLEKGASIYLVADVKEARPILNRLPIREINDTNVRQMIDRSNFAMAAIFPEQSGKRFQIAAWGNYPKSGAGMALGANNNWIKQRNKAGAEYWHSASDRLSLALTAKNLFVVSSLNNAPLNPITTSASSGECEEIPEGFVEFSRGAILSCWVAYPIKMLQQILNETGIPLRVPIRQLFVNLNAAAQSGRQSQKQYEAAIRLEFENASQARGMAAILNLVGAIKSNDPALQIAMLLLSNPPAQNDRYINLKINFSMLDEVISFLNNVTDAIK